MRFSTAISFIALQLSLMNVKGELTTTHTSASTLVSTILSPEMRDMVDESSIQLLGDPTCSALFENGLSSVAPLTNFLDHGIVLSTGNPLSLHLNGGKEDTCHQFSGDAYLNGMTNGITHDACVLEFQFITPAGAEKLNFDYVFGSDDYTPFNDAFALVLNGENLALIPNSEDFISVETVNDSVNSQYYINNKNSQYPNFEPNGFTTLLTAEGDLSPGALNTISFRIADGSDDCGVDSWVLIGGRSLNARGAKGDPHIIRWGGQKFDFHGICDLVLLKNLSFDNGLGMHIHIRNQKMKMWSYIETAAVRIGNDVLEIAGGKSNNIFWLNGVGKEVSFSDDNNVVSMLSGNPVVFKQINEYSREFIIMLGGNSEEAIVVKTFYKMVSVTVRHPSEESFGNSLGLMGRFPEGTMVARENVTILSNSNNFGQEWQVLADEPKLFRESKGPQYPKECDTPSSFEMRRRLALSEVNIEDAQAACAHITNREEQELCVFDVMATNDKTVVGAY